jgi:hypothetical protein
MEKKSKVTNVTGNGTWQSQYGTMFKFEVEFANGDIGEYNSKSKDQTNFIVGQDADYDISSKDYQGKIFYTVKPVKAVISQSFAGGGKYDSETSKKIARMSVLKCSTDLVISGHIRLETILEWAKILESYVEDGTSNLNAPLPPTVLPF